MKNHNRITRADVNFLESAVQAEHNRVRRIKEKPEPHQDADSIARLEKYLDRMRASMEKVRRVARLQLAEDQERRGVSALKDKVAYAMRDLS